MKVHSNNLIVLHKILTQVILHSNTSKNNSQFNNRLLKNRNRAMMKFVMNFRFKMNLIWGNHLSRLLSTILVLAHFL